ncbi:hypothetical protein NDU88_003860 [Pleurodeles waltl]|uniref:Uncharacterized protein n=1 Tax=Pleurodeles waltl TaxID=8319 RepID=A0AAV7VGJ6_PLEWA|nr:hypothetical protein NDU88_003860 [Pleurodeles waltl]
MPARRSRSWETRDQTPSPGPVQQPVLHHRSGISTQGVAPASSPVQQLPQHHQWPADRPDPRRTPSQSTTCTHRSSCANPPPHAAKFWQRRFRPPIESPSAGARAPTSTRCCQAPRPAKNGPTADATSRPTQTPLQPCRPQAPERSTGPAPIKATLHTRPRSDLTANSASG